MVYASRAHAVGGMPDQPSRRPSSHPHGAKSVSGFEKSATPLRHPKSADYDQRVRAGKDSIVATARVKGALELRAAVVVSDADRGRVLFAGNFRARGVQWQRTRHN